MYCFDKRIAVYDRTVENIMRRRLRKMEIESVTRNASSGMVERDRYDLIELLSDSSHFILLSSRMC